MEVPMDIQFRYMERRKKDLEVCLLNLEKKNFPELEKVGHQLKGNGLTFGHADLSSIGSHMEEAAASKDLSELEEALKEFSLWVNHHLN
jgi:HPt (histidine-containing phosphotransfer) domain-containing protein